MQGEGCRAKDARQRAKSTIANAAATNEDCENRIVLRSAGLASATNSPDVSPAALGTNMIRVKGLRLFWSKGILPGTPILLATRTALYAPDSQGTLLLLDSA